MFKQIIFSEKLRQSVFQVLFWSFICFGVAGAQQSTPTVEFGWKDIAMSLMSFVMALVIAFLRNYINRLETLEKSHSMLRDKIMTEHHTKREIEKVIETAIELAISRALPEALSSLHDELRELRNKQEN